MTAARYLPPELVACRRRQGIAWIERCADLEGWTAARLIAEREDFSATPLQAIEAEVERWRARMWEGMESRGLIPEHRRSHPSDPVTPEPHVRKPRGLAKHLVRKPPRSAPGTQAALFPDEEAA
ncbi:hypothetical protein D769_04349 [Cupriavidus sp. HMR-1]|uniref:hypothetical protein n=1 Tax=Cupriavidus sp. HMR-1 TaxID=1249621 RepID=UPI0002A2D99B|nr:hypothetical protein [Cupriavidus sp. HMR-1]ELA00630.1 hypothetical protein D769_04349 [Cupriavidus sp. HMR-1]